VAPRLYGERNETSRKDMRALWDGGLVIRGYKPWFLIVMGGMALRFFIPRTGGLLCGLAGGLLIIDAVTGVGGVLLGSIIKRGESRSRYHKAAAVIMTGVVGTLGTMVLLPQFQEERPSLGKTVRRRTAHVTGKRQRLKTPP
jgi:hypothetical protein